jgi:hypothetical protein
MIERASRDAVLAVFEQQAIEPSRDVAALLDAASRFGLSLIAGWDTSSATNAVAKVYVNASDASEPSRAAAWRAVGWAGIETLPTAPHLLALNATSRSVTRKAYVQDADPTPAPGFGSAASTLSERIARAGAFAGAVACWDLAASERDPSPRARAWFAGIREGGDVAIESLLASLPGWDTARVNASLPFERGACRSIGVAAGEALAWTAYFKPRGQSSPLWDLEPVARFAHGEWDVAVYFAPRDHGPRAFARTETTAVSFRGADSAPPHVVEPLYRWVVECVRASEGTGRAVEPALALPPSPWTLRGSVRPGALRPTRRP